MATSPASSQPITVIVVDDHKLLRGLLVDALAEVRDIQVIGDVADAEAAAKLCQASRPHVLVLDCMLPGQQGPEAVEKLLQISPATKVLMFSGATSPLAIRRALAAGARGFVPKSAPIDELIEGIRAVHAGHIFCGVGTRRLIQGILADLPRFRPKSPLSARELDVLSGIAQGKPSKQIATQLGLSVYTVENHRRRIMNRIGVHSIAGLTLLAVEMGLVAVRRAGEEAEDGGAEPGGVVDRFSAGT